MLACSVVTAAVTFLLAKIMDPLARDCLLQELGRLGVGQAEIALALECVFGKESEGIHVRQYIQKDYESLGEDMQGDVQNHQPSVIQQQMPWNAFVS